MQTLYKFSVSICLLFILGCEDNLQTNPEEVSTTITNSLTISLQDPAEMAINGNYELLVTGPKEFRSVEKESTVKLVNLPAGKYTISIAKAGHVPFIQQIQINDAADKRVEQRYRIEVPLAKKGELFRFQNNTGATVLFPKSMVSEKDASFPIMNGLSRYNSVRMSLLPCSLAGENCNGDILLSASIIPLHATFMTESLSASKIPLFLLDLESDKNYRFSKTLEVEFPVIIKKEPLKGLKYVMERVIKDANTGILSFTGEFVPVSISVDGSKGTAQLPDANSDWVFEVQVKLETTVSPVPFSSVVKSKKPGVEVVANVSLNQSIDPILTDLLGLSNNKKDIQEVMNVIPARDKVAEISFNILNRKFTLRNPISNETILISTDIPIYPLAFKTVIGVPHDSGGGG